MAAANDDAEHMVIAALTGVCMEFTFEVHCNNSLKDYTVVTVASCTDYG